ncbi:unnamed protein product [Fraxinus pennsylvanica]|uniref:Uncharacterized protein n=1 Tax=Fraxinus pennsylvanica TaxID=56036 RepID=A0AAD2A751_9LAMI|nr:unnamed protein product [Fraxinus pennsylvanica]
MNEGLKLGTLDNGQYLSVYLKEVLPSSLHDAASDQILPVIVIVQEGFKVEQKGCIFRNEDHFYVNEFGWKLNPNAGKADDNFESKSGESKLHPNSKHARSSSGFVFGTFSNLEYLSVLGNELTGYIPR